MKRAGRMNLQIVVPLTSWQPHFAQYFWLVQLLPTQSNGLRKESAADVFQIKSVSVNRFQRKLGAVTNLEVNRITKAIALCIGYDPTV
jgi:mRNA interferase MazF